jgi:serine/threonine-protein kinase
MQQSDEPATPDLDDGTWHQPSESPATMPPEDSTRIKPSELESSEVEPIPAVHTVPGANSTPNSNATVLQRESGDSDEATPRPGGEGSNEWDLLPAPIIKKGNVVFGTYLLEDRLGRGGMGEVWRVENIPLQKETALKLIDPRYAQDDKAWERFKREARVMAKIDHPNAVAVYAFRRSHGMAYIEMEYVPGCSLEKYLKDRSSPVPLEWTNRLLDQLCSVLQEAHGHVDKKSGKAKPIIHRDLKPSNLMLAEDKSGEQVLKVLDFGIAKMVHDEASPELTNPGDFVGTPHYMSPEQIRGGVGKDGGGEIDGRSDLYSVGVLLYQLLTGSLPFRGGSNMEVLVAHLHQSPRPMREANPRAKVPPEVERLVMRCLEKDPDLRPSSARELARLFKEAIKGQERSRPAKHSWQKPVLLLIAACALLAGLVLGAPRLKDLVRTRIRGVPKKVVPGEQPEVPVHDAEYLIRTAWEKQGYETLAADQLETLATSQGYPLEKTSGDVDPPAGLRRVSDNVVFYAFAKGIYLPLGYHADDAGDLVGFWPKVIVRSSDNYKVRFIRIEEGKYTRGDFRTHSPVQDLQRNPCKPHEVSLSGFYIQETEVTNREMQAFSKEHLEARLKSWKRILTVMIDEEKRPEEDVMQYPAVFVDRATAQQAAQSVEGRLPTEAEWEFAARSRGQNQLWAGKNSVAKKSFPKAYLATNPNATDPFPVPVKTYRGEDETDQKVFDMTGNVREWCHDVYKPYDEIIAENKNRDRVLNDPRVGGEPRADAPDLKYVVRGGSFMDQPEDAMTFQRNGIPASEELGYVGFRVVIQCPPEIVYNSN